jgi:hypothetical protein
MRRDSAGSGAWRLAASILAALAEQLKQHREKIDEVEIERQRTEHGFLASGISRVRLRAARRPLPANGARLSAPVDQSYSLDAYDNFHGIMARAVFAMGALPWMRGPAHDHATECLELSLKPASAASLNSIGSRSPAAARSRMFLAILAFATGVRRGSGKVPTTSSMTRRNMLNSSGTYTEPVPDIVLASDPTSTENE